MVNIKNVGLVAAGLFVAKVGYAETPVPKQVWKLTAQHSGKCLDVREAGSVVIQNDCSDSASQNFYMHEWSDGAFSFISPTSNLCVGVKDKSVEDGSSLLFSDCLGEDHEKLSVWRSSEGVFHLKFQSTRKCLAINDAGDAVQDACNEQANQNFVFTKMEGAKIPVLPKEPVVLIDTSDEMNAEARPFHIKNLKRAEYVWEVFDFSGSTPIVLEDNDAIVDMLALGEYAGKFLRVTVKADGRSYSGKYPIMISKVEILQADSKEFKPKPDTDLGLVASRPELEVSYEVRKREACQKKFVVSLDGVFTQTDCTTFTWPDFKPGQQNTINVAVISAFNTLTKKVKNASGVMENQVLQCAIKTAQATQGEFKRPKGEKEPTYNNANAAAIVQKQIDLWNVRLGDKLENFKIHFAMNYKEKPNYVLGHANVGQVQKDLSHIRIQNQDKSRFEINLNHNLISEDADKAKEVTLILKDGTELPYTTDIKELAGTIAHEMIHQMGLTHTTDEKGDDEQDDFVYELGSCVKKHIEISKEWYSGI